MDHVRAPWVERGFHRFSCLARGKGVRAMLAGRTVLVAINLLIWTAVLLAIAQFYQTTSALPLTSIRGLHILAFRFDPVLYTFRHNTPHTHTHTHFHTLSHTLSFTLPSHFLTYTHTPSPTHFPPIQTSQFQPPSSPPTHKHTSSLSLFQIHFLTHQLPHPTPPPTLKHTSSLSHFQIHFLSVR